MPLSRVLPFFFNRAARANVAGAFRLHKNRTARANVAGSFRLHKNRAARANVGVGFIPILQGFKGYFFLPFRRDSGAFPLENGDKPHPYIG